MNHHNLDIINDGNNNSLDKGEDNNDKNNNNNNEEYSGDQHQCHHQNVNYKKDPSDKHSDDGDDTRLMKIQSHDTNNLEG